MHDSLHSRLEWDSKNKRQDAINPQQTWTLVLLNLHKKHWDPLGHNLTFIGRHLQTLIIIVTKYLLIEFRHYLLSVLHVNIITWFRTCHNPIQCIEPFPSRPRIDKSAIKFVKIGWFQAILLRKWETATSHAQLYWVTDAKEKPANGDFYQD